MKHPVEHLRFPEAAVEPGAKFRQIAGQMFGTDAVADAPNIAFDIGGQGMDPGQELRSLLPRTGHQPLMKDTVVARGNSPPHALTAPDVNLSVHPGRT
jgi:hypothetical protein